MRNPIQQYLQWNSSDGELVPYRGPTPPSACAPAQPPAAELDCFSSDDAAASSMAGGGNCASVAAQRVLDL
jgi:hypothetical protein